MKVNQKKCICIFCAETRDGQMSFLLREVQLQASLRQVSEGWKPAGQ